MLSRVRTDVADRLRHPATTVHRPRCGPRRHPGQRAQRCRQLGPVASAGVESAASDPLGSPPSRWASTDDIPTPELAPVTPIGRRGAVRTTEQRIPAERGAPLSEDTGGSQPKEFAIRVTSVDDLFAPYDARPVAERPLAEEVRFHLLDAWEHVRTAHPAVLHCYAPASEREQVDEHAVTAALRRDMRAYTHGLRRAAPLSRRCECGSARLASTQIPDRSASPSGRGAASSGFSSSRTVTTAPAPRR